MKRNTILIILLFTLVLTSCGDDKTNEESSEQPVFTISKENIEKAKKEINTQEDAKDENEGNGKITVNSKCIGCMRCVRVAPDNFAHDVETRKAIVISQKDSSSSSVDRAIEICPVDAIERV